MLKTKIHRSITVTASDKKNKVYLYVHKQEIKYICLVSNFITVTDIDTYQAKSIALL